MKKFAAVVIGCMFASAVVAADQGLLIQVQPGGAYRVGHNDGPTELEACG